MKLPRVLIAAPASGSGKTVLTCGLLRYLKDSGISVRSYKCGPDYIDPMFHRQVIGIPGGNLDSFFSDEEDIRRQIADSRSDTVVSDAVVIEGVMGIYDGIAGLTGRGSCYDIAMISGTPVILVMDVRGMGTTMTSLLKGILADDRACLIRGVILNRISENYYNTVNPLISGELSRLSEERGRDVRLLGGIPQDNEIKLSSRHLGLIMPGEISDLDEQVDAASRLIQKYIDTDALLSIMDGAAELPDQEPEPGPDRDGPVLAVARDEAFCFYYEENLRMLERAGIRMAEFSPLHDSSIPEGADGFLLGGGYPELFAEQLSRNESMRRSVRDAAAAGMPSLAECGGFMYLLGEMTADDGETYPMAGVIPGASHNTGRLGRFGYVTVTGTGGQEHRGDSLISGLSIRGHEFHYYDSSNNGSDAAAVKPGSGRSWECIHAGPEHVWGYPHLYYPSCPELIGRFREAMIRYREREI